MRYNYRVKAYYKHKAAAWKQQQDEWDALIMQWAMEGDFLLSVA